jgi:16S rRNA G966 N2-methylase RsmD
MEQAKKLGLRIIRILQEDVYNKTFDLELLFEALKSIEIEIYLPNRELYKNHSFPWKVYSTEEIHEDFVNLKLLKNSGNSCSNFFFQYERLNTPNINGNSAVEYFYNEKEDIIKRSEESKRDLLSTITWLNHSPAQFSPLLACKIYKFFEATSVFDPYAGWGDRCVAAMSMDINYTGVDKNPRLTECYENMMEEYERNALHSAQRKSNVEFINDSAENYIINLDVSKFDLVFSSPPFYKPNGKIVEQYNETEVNYEKFMETSLIPVMNKFKNADITICLYIPHNMYMDLKDKYGFGMANIIRIDKKRNLYFWGKISKF